MLFSPSSSFGSAAHVTWGFRFQSTAAIPAGGAATIALPGADAFTVSSTFASMLDLTTGADELASDVVTGGSSIAVTSRDAIAVGGSLPCSHCPLSFC